MTIDQVIQTLKDAGFNGQGLIYAIATVLAENGRLDPTAMHQNNDPSVTPPAYLGSYDVGLFQINQITAKGYGYTIDQLKDPLTNAKLAFQISSGGGQGFGPGHGSWSTWLNGVPSTLGAAEKAIIAFVSGVGGGVVGGIAGGGGGTTASNTTATATAAPPGDGDISTPWGTVHIPALATIQQAFTAIGGSFTSIGSDIQAISTFFNQPDLLWRILLVIFGAGVLLVGVLLFSLSFVDFKDVKNVGDVAGAVGA